MKTVNVNFILVMVVVLFLFAVSGKSYFSLRGADKALNKLVGALGSWSLVCYFDGD